MEAAEYTPSWQWAVKFRTRQIIQAAASDSGPNWQALVRRSQGPVRTATLLQVADSESQAAASGAVASSS